MLEKVFKLESNNTSLGKEVLAGITTFVTMAYIIFVNPQMMAVSGMDLGASFVGTCIAASLACIIMGIYSNWPVSLAPGMGLNAFFTYTVVGEMGYSWEGALGAVFLAGVLFFIMSVTRLRRWMLDSIPLNLRIAMGAGVGLFIGFIGLKNGGLIVANSATFLSLGDLTNPETILAAFGFLIICSLSVRNAPGAILIGVMLVTVLSVFLGLIEFRGLVSMPPSIAPTFDTAGTLLGVATRAKITDELGNAKNFDKALKADSSSSVFGTFFGCSPVTSYVESSAGVEAGGRTGLTTVVVGLLFLIAIFFSPLAAIVPAYATAGALIYVSILMMSGMERLNWSDTTELLPALVIIVMIPLTFSIANGIALGFLAYVVLKISNGEIKNISSGAWFLTAVFVSKFLFL